MLICTSIGDEHTAIHLSRACSRNGGNVYLSYIFTSLGSMTNESLSTIEQSEQRTALFLDFVYYKIDRGWKMLPKEDRQLHVTEFLSVFHSYTEKLKIRSYSTIGLRHETDFLLWLTDKNVDVFQEVVGGLGRTQLGKYLEIEYLWLSMTRPSTYTKRHLTAFELGEEPLRYAIVYPFVKSRDWYLLPFEERKRMMEEHGKVGKEFPKVKLNTTYSFGIDDQDFTLAFETDDLKDFQELMIKLRSTEASKYVVRDTPMIVSKFETMESIFATLMG